MSGSNVADVDLVETYRRITKSASKGQGTRLTALECQLIARDEAVRGAIDAADYEDKNYQ